MSFYHGDAVNFVKYQPQILEVCGNGIHKFKRYKWDRRENKRVCILDRVWENSDWNHSRSFIVNSKHLLVITLSMICLS